MRSLIRSFIVDPELEKKAHQLADEALKTAGEARKTLRSLGRTNDLITLAGLGLLVAGFVAGSAIEQSRGQIENRPAEDTAP